MNKVYNAIDEVDGVYNGVFLAGPSPRVGQTWTDWRIELIDILRKKGFDGDIFNPVNPNYDTADPTMYERQCAWENRCLHYASLIVFWVDRNKEHPALTTNVEFGIWSAKCPKSIVAGFPPQSEHVGYLKWICDKKGIPYVESMEQLSDLIIAHFDRKPKPYFTSDTHFGSDRHIEMSKRPYRSVEEMDLEFISNWNKTTTANDEVHHLGDFGNLDVLPFLNFKTMYLLKGNYENKEEHFVVKDRRVFVMSKMTVDLGDGKIACIHEPLTNRESGFYLYGHIHEKGKVKRNGFNVGIDANNYELVDADTIKFYKTAIEKFYDENVFTDLCGQV